MNQTHPYDSRGTSGRVGVGSLSTYIWNYVRAPSTSRRFAYQTAHRLLATLAVGRETPFLAARADIAFGDAFAKQQMHLLANQARLFPARLLLNFGS
jgi:hypothetical protein